MELGLPGTIEASPQPAAREGSVPWTATHLPALDGVRGLAIALVLAYHFVAFSEPASLVERALVQVCDFGAAGVDLFFLLSGFLITGILVETRGRSHFFRNFYTRRVLRIFPLYYGVLVAVFLIAPRIPGLHSAQLDKMRKALEIAMGLTKLPDDPGTQAGKGK